MRPIHRRGFLSCGLAALASPALGASPLRDSAGRAVAVSGAVTRVMAAGPPASAVVYCLAPEKLIGWQRTPTAEERPYLIPGTRDLPELGRLAGRGDTANIEVVLKAKPDVIVDFGAVSPTYISLANSVQERTGVPYVLIDGRFASTAASLRLLGEILGVRERAEALARYAETTLGDIDERVARSPEAQRPGVYLARGSNGLETALRGSINAEILERAGGRNVAAAEGARRGIANVSPEQLLVWKPDIIVTWQRDFFKSVTEAPDAFWTSVPAVANKRVYLAPTAPFGWIDGPPSVNRLIGLRWCANIFMGAASPFDIERDTRAFYKLFYQVDLSDADLARLIAWANGKPPESRP
jgi:iron complex transport system substrate-binding protein